MIQRDTYTQFATVHEVGAHGDVLHVFGDVDLTTAAMLDAAIVDASADDKALLVNFARCRYLDTSGLTVLIRARKRMLGRLRLLVAPQSAIFRVMQIAGLVEVFSVVTALDAPERPLERIEA